jgi:hypothetical protein
LGFELQQWIAAITWQFIFRGLPTRGVASDCCVG